jgi:hypothetical protein
MRQRPIICSLMFNNSAFGRPLQHSLWSNYYFCHMLGSSIIWLVHVSMHAHMWRDLSKISTIQLLFWIYNFESHIYIVCPFFFHFLFSYNLNFFHLIILLIEANHLIIIWYFFLFFYYLELFYFVLIFLWSWIVLLVSKIIF